MSEETHNIWLQAKPGSALVFALAPWPVLPEHER